jgi:hypothetical protein
MAAHASFGSLDFATCPHKKTPDIFYLRHQPYKLLLVYLSLHSTENGSDQQLTKLSNSDDPNDNPTLIFYTFREQ